MAQRLDTDEEEWCAQTVFFHQTESRIHSYHHA